MKKEFMSQTQAPIYEALERFREMRVVPFDVPGHKHGKATRSLPLFSVNNVLALMSTA
jgi:arginine/lysine/ornithine decarboxylase